MSRAITQRIANPAPLEPVSRARWPPSLQAELGRGDVVVYDLRDAGLLVFRGKRCGACHKVADRLQQHALRHMNREMREMYAWRCPLCAASFSQKIAVKNHINALHTHETEWCCQRADCRFLTYDRSSLIRHMGRIHNTRVVSTSASGAYTVAPAELGDEDSPGEEDGDVLGEGDAPREGSVVALKEDSASVEEEDASEEESHGPVKKGDIPAQERHIQVKREPSDIEMGHIPVERGSCKFWMSSSPSTSAAPSTYPVTSTYSASSISSAAYQSFTTRVEPDYPPGWVIDPTESLCPNPDGSMDRGDGTSFALVDGRCGFPDCGLTFSRRIEFVRHSLVHMTKEKRERLSWGCGVPGCGKRYSTKNSLKEHYVSRHTDTQPLQCRLCTQVFRRRDALSRHLGRTHKLRAQEPQTRRRYKPASMAAARGAAMRAREVSVSTSRGASVETTRGASANIRGTSVGTMRGASVTTCPESASSRSSTPAVDGLGLLTPRSSIVFSDATREAKVRSASDGEDDAAGKARYASEDLHVKCPLVKDEPAEVALITEGMRSAEDMDTEMTLVCSESP
ncbi:hypothetical protein HDZ31DRAFT_66793 [Schizophyllum fasciatum]